MQEQKEFSTTLFGFEKKAVLEYIYEQDKQARAALADLANRNAALDEQAQDLNARLEALSAECDSLRAQSGEQGKALQEKEEICVKYQSRLDKQNNDLRDKESSLQLQMEINKKLQERITEQNTVIESLRRELKRAEGRCRLFESSQRDYSDLHSRLEQIRSDFEKRINDFQRDFERLEASSPSSARGQKVTPRMKNCGLDNRLEFSASEAENVLSDVKPAPMVKNRLSTILDEWK